MTQPKPGPSNLVAAAASARQFSAGLARTLARPAPPAVGLPAPFAAGGGVAQPAGFPHMSGSGALQQIQAATPASPAALPVPGSPAPGSTPTRRSPAQVSAVLSRMIAQGQRNL
jgi:hypothetical protein